MPRDKAKKLEIASAQLDKGVDLMEEELCPMDELGLANRVRAMEFYHWTGNVCVLKEDSFYFEGDFSGFSL